jgi:hypothetical protein
MMRTWMTTSNNDATDPLNGNRAAFKADRVQELLKLLTAGSPTYAAIK